MTIGKTNGGIGHIKPAIREKMSLRIFYFINAGMIGHIIHSFIMIQQVVINKGMGEAKTSVLPAVKTGFIDNRDTRPGRLDSCNFRFLKSRRTGKQGVDVPHGRLKIKHRISSRAIRNTEQSTASRQQRFYNIVPYRYFLCSFQIHPQNIIADMHWAAVTELTTEPSGVSR